MAPRFWPQKGAAEFGWVCWRPGTLVGSPRPSLLCDAGVRTRLCSDTRLSSGTSTLLSFGSQLQLPPATADRAPDSPAGMQRSYPRLGESLPPASASPGGLCQLGSPSASPVDPALPQPEAEWDSLPGGVGPRDSMLSSVILGPAQPIGPGAFLSALAGGPAVRPRALPAIREAEQGPRARPPTGARGAGGGPGELGGPAVRPVEAAHQGDLSLAASRTLPSPASAGPSPARTRQRARGTIMTPATLPRSPVPLAPRSPVGMLVRVLPEPGMTCPHLADPDFIHGRGEIRWLSMVVAFFALDGNGTVMPAPTHLD